MNKLITFLLILSLSSCNLFRGKTADQLFDPKPITLPQGGEQVVQGINQLGFDILKKIAYSRPEENNMISPFSLAAVLTMLQQGAENQTLEELNTLLNLNNLSKENVAKVYQTIMQEMPEIDKNVQFYPANSLWIKNTLSVNNDYKALTKEYFLTDIFTEQFDNNTVNNINNWVKDKTQGKIDKIVDDLSGNVMVLINAVYFYGSWLDKFNEQNTTKQVFHLDSAHSALVSTMIDEIDHVGFGWFDSVLVGELFYGQGNFSMVVVVPQNTYDINSFIQNLDTQTWNSWLSELSNREINVYLPKFSFSPSYPNLKDILRSLGLNTVFSTQADFNDINPSIFLSMVAQKNYIKVNEQGTEAASVSSGFMETSAPKLLNVNRPFLFAIRENTTGLILFLGVVNNPEQ